MTTDLKIALDRINGMCVDALDNSLFSFIPKIKRSTINQSLQPLIRTVLIVELCPLCQFKGCLDMFTEQLIDLMLVFILAGLLEHCLVDLDEDTDELVGGSLLACWNDHDLEDDGL